MGPGFAFTGGKSPGLTVEAMGLRQSGSAQFLAALPDDEDDPRRWLLLWFDEADWVLEPVILAFGSGEELVVGAMKARPLYLDLVP